MPTARKLKPVFLSVEELAQIEQTPMPFDYLENAKRWLLLGCEIGQRVGDLLGIITENLKAYKGLIVVELKQEKTAKRVIIPLSPHAEKSPEICHGESATKNLTNTSKRFAKLPKLMGWLRAKND